MVGEVVGFVTGIFYAMIWMLCNVYNSSVATLRVFFSVRYFIHPSGCYSRWYWPSVQRDHVRRVFKFVTSPSRRRVVSKSSTLYRPCPLSAEELRLGCKLGFDSWADTCCAGRHAHVDEFIEGKSVTANGFSSSLPSIPDLPIANVSYAYDAPTGEVFILDVNNAIYLGESMEDSLLCPNQCRENGVSIDTRPKAYCDSPTAATMTCNETDHVFHIRHHGPMPYIQVRRPTHEELLSCVRIQLTAHDDWNPYDSIGSIDHAVSSIVQSDPALQDAYDSVYDDMCSISSVLMGAHVSHCLRQVSTLVRVDDRADSYESSISAVASRKKDRLTPEALSRLWKCGLKTAERTLKATTHQCLRTTGILTKRFRTDRAHMRYKRLSTKNGLFYVDTLFAKVKSIRGFTCGNLYTNKLGFKKFYPMTSESQSSFTLQNMIEVVGVPPAIHSDNAKAFLQGDFRKKCRKYDIKQSSTEPHSPWQNRAEYGIHELKSYAHRLMESTQAPVRLWCFAYEYAADVLCLMATGLYSLGGRTPYEIVMHYTPDISEFVTFEWYQWAYYWDQHEKEKRLCRWLGVAHSVGQSMCYWILTIDGSFIARSTVIPIPDSDLNDITLKERMERFDASVHDVIGNHHTAIVRNEGPLREDRVYYDALYHDPASEDITYPWDTELHDLPLHEENEAAHRDLDEYIGAEVVLPGVDGVEVLCKVKSRKRDGNGVVIGEANSNPILDTRIFNVEFPDGHVDEYATNVIAESLYANVDDEGYSLGAMKEIVDFRKSDKAVSAADGYVMSGTTRKPVITTKGWDLCILWEDGSRDWLPLSQVKQAYPLEVAEFAVAQKIHHEPAFNWWVNHTLRKRDRMIAKASTRMRKNPRMKFGIEIPETVEDALELDKKNGNSYWADAIKKEYENVKVAFQLLKDHETVPPGYKEITCHLVFEVKFDLRRKARYVAGGHLTDPPASMTYASVVSRESVRIGFLVAALNGLDILAGDIQNAYLNAPTEERVWFRAGKEWGANEGKPILVVRALYGLKGSGRAWRNHLADTLRNVLGFKSSLADPDVWFKPMTKPCGAKYYAYILVYTDDVLIIDANPMVHMEKLQTVYKMKKGSVGPPTVYLGANIQPVDCRVPGERQCWGMSAEQYVRDSVKNVKQRLKDLGVEFNKKLSDVNYSPRQPFSNAKYRPEIDVSTPCNDDQCTLYQNLIGILRWIIELGRIDIHFEVACLSQHLCYPRLGHLHQALHIFKYLEIHRESFLSFDPTRLDIGESLNTFESPATKARDMKQFYPDAEEALPSNAPEPRGEAVQINCFVDADHAGNLVTRRSHSGILIFLNMAPISWFSKRQNSVETSTFSSEFIALKLATEQILALRYKLRMFGIPIEGPARVFCDNEAVYKNASNAASTLKRKHQSVAFHMVRSAVACSVLYVIKEDSGSNLSDILTKSLPPEQRVYLRERIMIREKVKSLPVR